MTEKIKDFVLVPKVAFWSFVITIAIALFGSYLYTNIALVKLDNKIEIYRTEMDSKISLLRLEFEKDHGYITEITNENKAMYRKIQDDIGEIKTAMKLKQDKKFIP